MKKVWISLINYNGKNDTLDCLKTLSEVKTKDIELSIVVVDNNSKEKFGIPKNIVKNHNTKVIYNTENKGFSGGHNVVIQKAIENAVDYVLILNNDTIVDSNFLEKLLA